MSSSGVQGGADSAAGSTTGLEATFDTDNFTDDLVEASLWSDAWRQLRKRPAFWLCAVIIGLMTVVAVVPGPYSSLRRAMCMLQGMLVLPL